MSDISLVSMPFAPLEWPSIGLGQLVTAAKQAGMDIKATYPSLRFAEVIGVPTYRLIAEIARADSLLGEWIFSKAAYKDFDFPHDEYMEYLLGNESGFRRYFFAYYKRKESFFRQEFQELRRIAEQFVETIAREILETHPRIVGCSTSFQQYTASVALLRHIKNLDPSVVTLLGGAHCEAEMGYMTAQKFSWVDFVVSGEADHLFPELCQHILERGSAVPSEHIPKGVYCQKNISALQRKSGGGEKPLVATAIVPSLNEVPVPDYGDYFEEFNRTTLHQTLKPKLVIESSRGCWKGQKNPCHFCGLNGERWQYRTKSTDRVLQELEVLYETYGIHTFIVADTILNMSYFNTLFKELSRKHKPYKFVFETTSNLQENQVQLLANAGVVAIQPGIESLHDTLLGLLNKGNSAIQNIALLKYALENGITVTWNLLYGIPGDREHYYREMVDFLPLIYHLEPPTMTPVRYDRFSQYHTESEGFGLTLAPLRVYQYVYPFEPDELDDFACFFEDRGSNTHQELFKPGIWRLVNTIIEWRKLFYVGSKKGSQRPELICQEIDERTMIVDTRPCAVAPEWTLTGIEHVIHKACRHPITKIHLYDSLCSSTSVEDEGLLEDGIAQLLQKKLLLQINQHYLALATFEPRRRLTKRY